MENMNEEAVKRILEKKLKEVSEDMKETMDDMFQELTKTVTEAVTDIMKGMTEIQGQEELTMGLRDLSLDGPIINVKTVEELYQKTNEERAEVQGDRILQNDDVVAVADVASEVAVRRSNMGLRDLSLDGSTSGELDVKPKEERVEVQGVRRSTRPKFPTKRYAD